MRQLTEEDIQKIAKELGIEPIPGFSKKLLISQTIILYKKNIGKIESEMLMLGPTLIKSITKQKN